MKVQLKKYPKSPKANASASAKENYIKKVAAVNTENQRRISLSKQIATLTGKLNGTPGRKGKKRKGSKKRRK